MQIEHIAIVVKDLEKSIKLYENLFGVRAVCEEYQGMIIAILPTEAGKIELLYPKEPDSVAAKFLAKNGEGVHHIAMGVNDVKPCLNKANELGIGLLDQEARPGVDNKMIAFLHPKDTNHVLWEFCMDK